MTATGVIDIAVPDIGDFTDVPVIEILVAPGDEVGVDDPLVTLESDKATMDVPAPVAGVVKQLLVKIGDKLSEGALVLTLEPTADEEPARGDSMPAIRALAAEATPAPDPPPERPRPPDPAPPARAIDTPSAAAVSPPRDAPPYASPSVRRIARELGVTINDVSGTGRKGRITKADVESYLASPPAPAVSPAVAPGATGLDLAPWPSVNFEKYGPIERRPLSRIQKISARNLARNWVMIPHVTQNDEADVTELEAFRKQLNEEHARDGVKLTMVGFLVVASVATLKAFPDFNASLDGEELVVKRYYNIGFAADTPHGLVVPVIKNADEKGIFDIARELTALSGKAREGKLGPAEMTGATFTISSLGGIGGTGFTPIINAPELAILGVSRAAMKPVWNGKEFLPRLMVPLSLSYDHRVIDGAAAARFTAHLGKVLSDLRRALL